MVERERRTREDRARVGSPGPAGPGPGGHGSAELPSVLDAAAIAAVQRQAGNAAASELIARHPGMPAAKRDPVQRQQGRRGGAAPTTLAPMSRADFEAEATRYGVGRVSTGTLDQQVTRLNSMSGGDRLGDVLRSDVAAGRQQWVSWDPGASSPAYRAIIGGLADFATAMGGLPPIREIAFFKRDYVGMRIGGDLRTSWGATGADYSGGAMQVYENAVLQATAKVLPTARDASGAPATADQPTEAQGMGRVITHELGHGLQEVAHDPAAVGRAAGPLLMERYARAIGWRQMAGGDREWRLYDVLDPAVTAAFDAGRLPEDRYRITADTWQQGWREQPISRYQVRTGPFEDFPEAVMAYIANRAVLQQRSPTRHDFIRSVITELAGRLGTPASAPSGGGTGTGGGAIERAGGGGEALRP